VSLLEARSAFADALSGQGWQVDFCCCNATVQPRIPGVDSLAYYEFKEAVPELNRQATLMAELQRAVRPHGGRALHAQGRSSSSAAAAEDPAEALDREFLALSTLPLSGCGATSPAILTFHVSNTAQLGFISLHSGPKLTAL
jgi:hypothetical protein